VQAFKTYFALKIDRVTEEGADHMKRPRRAILEMGRCGDVSNVFHRASNWHCIWQHCHGGAVPMMARRDHASPEVVFPFHLSKVSYWARTVIVPLLVLNNLRPVAINHRGVCVDELFRTSAG